MGKPKTSTVGGGANRQTADAWGQFLQNGLQTGVFGNQGQGGSQNGGVDGSGGSFGNGDGSAFQGGGSGNNYPGGGTANGRGTQQGFAGAINNQLGGGFGAGQFTAANMPTAPQFRETQFNPLNNNMDLSQYNFQNSNPGYGSDFMNNMFANANRMAGGGGLAAIQAGTAGTSATGVPDFYQGLINANQQLGNLPTVDINDPTFAALKQQQEQSTARGLADTRARFGVGGGMAFGTPAAFAENDYRTQATNRNILGLNELANSMRGQNREDRNVMLSQIGLTNSDMANRLGLNSASQLGNRQISSSESIANANNATQANIASAANQLQAMGMGNQQIGQLLNYMVNNEQLNLAGQGQNAANAFNAGQFNNAATQTMNQNQFQNNNAFNNFGLGMFGQQSQNAFNNANMQNNFNLNNAQMRNQAQQSGMNQLFGSYQQANQIGSPQAQIIQTPNGWQQFVGGVNDVIGMAAGVKNLFSPFPSNRPAQPSTISQMSGPISNSQIGFGPGGPGWGTPTAMPNPVSSLMGQSPGTNPVSSGYNPFSGMGAMNSMAPSGMGMLPGTPSVLMAPPQIGGGGVGMMPGGPSVLMAPQGGPGGQFTNFGNPATALSAGGTGMFAGRGGLTMAPTPGVGMMPGGPMLYNSRMG